MQAQSLPAAPVVIPLRRRHAPITLDAVEEQLRDDSERDLRRAHHVAHLLAFGVTDPGELADATGLARRDVVDALSRLSRAAGAVDAAAARTAAA